jgi:hypothetical protein
LRGQEGTKQNTTTKKQKGETEKLCEVKRAREIQNEVANYRGVFFPSKISGVGTIFELLVHVLQGTK